MVRIFRHYVPGSLLALAVVEFLYLLAMVYTARLLRLGEPREIVAIAHNLLPEAIIFALVLSVTMFALGLYHKEHARDLGTIFVRLLFSFLFGFVALSFIYYLYPDVEIWRSVFAIAFVAGIAGIMVLRWVFTHIADIDAFKRRVLVLGVGRRAAKIEALEKGHRSHGFTCVGFVPLNDAGADIVDGEIWGNMSLADLAREQGVEEIIVAVEERRNGTPVDALLACKLDGIDITEYATFWERETGRVDLDALHPSWLIFSDGFVGGRLQSAAKRVFDVLASILLLLVALPVVVIAALVITLESRGGIFYRQERVGLNGRSFSLLKFRSMRPDAEKDSGPQWAAADDARVTRVGTFIRRTRIDEIPQIFNVLRGDMSFIGPRPERPFFVEELRRSIPYYFERHRVKPGISGWAQLNYPYGASVEDAKEKFQYDLYYIKNYSVFLDLIVLLQTVRVVLWPHSAR